jgi:hypothetical protein
VDLSVGGRLDLASAARTARLDLPVAGVVLADATVRGLLAAPAVSAHLAGSSLMIRNIQEIEVAVTAAYDLTARRATVSSFDARGPWGTIAGQGTLALENDGDSELQADIRALDVASLMRAVDLPYEVAARADGQVQMKWPGLDVLRATGDAHASLTPTRETASRSQIPVAGRLDLHAREGPCCRLQ